MEEVPDIEDVCSNLPDQEEQVDEAFYRQIGVVSYSLALVLTANFNHTGTCWRENTDGNRQPWRFLESTDDNFATQVIKEPARRDALLDLTLKKKERLIGFESQRLPQLQ